MGEDPPATGRFQSCHPLQFLHEKLVRKPVKTVTLNAHSIVFARNREQARHSGHCGMKSSVEASDLGQLGEPALEGLDERHYPGQMLRVQRDDLAQLVDHI